MRRIANSGIRGSGAVVLLAAALLSGCAAPAPSVPVTFQPESLSCKVTSGRGIRGGLFAGEILLASRMVAHCEEHYKLYYALNIGDGNAATVYALADFSLRGVLVLERNGEVCGIMVLKPVAGCAACNGGEVSLACVKGAGRDDAWCNFAGNGPVSIAFAAPRVEYPAEGGGETVILSSEVEFATRQGDGSARIDFQIATGDRAAPDR